MPKKPLKPCAITGCPNLCVGTYCDVHKKVSDKTYNRFNRDKLNKSFYTSMEWRKLRRVHLDANPLCVECLKEGRHRVATIVDHIVPIKDGGKPLDPSNLQSLCWSCHTTKSNKEGSAGFGKTIR